MAQKLHHHFQAFPVTPNRSQSMEDLTMMNFAAFLGALVIFTAALTFDLFAFEVKTVEPIQPPQSTDARELPEFEQLDRNRDDLISPMEAEGSWLAEPFAEVDLNQDGFVNQVEYEGAIS